MNNPLICPRCFTAHQKDLDISYCIECGYKFPRTESGDYLTDEEGVALLEKIEDTQNAENQQMGNSNPIQHPQYIEPPFNPQYPQKMRKKWTFAAGIYVPLLSYILILIGVFAIILIAVLFGVDLEAILDDGDILDDSALFLFVSGLISALGFIVVPVFFVQRYTKDKLSVKERMNILGVSVEKYSRKELIIELLFGVCIGLLGIFLVRFLSILSYEFTSLVYHETFESYYNSSSFESVMFEVPEKLSSLILFVMTIVLFVGVPEELMFRGFVQKCFETKLSKGAATLLTAVYFSLFHIFIFIIAPPIFLFLFIPYFGISLLLGFIANKRKNLTAVIVAHIIYDITEIIVLYAILN